MNLITKLDFDGLLCAAMIGQREDLGEIYFSTPREIESFSVPFEIKTGDILAHLPFHKDVSMWFNNNDWEHISADVLNNVNGRWGEACCTAELVKLHYEDPEMDRYDELIEVASRIECANLTEEDVLHPSGWMLVNYTLDPRFPADRDYGVKLAALIREGKTAEEILQTPEVAARVEKYKSEEQRFVEELKANSRVDANIIITDFREMEVAPRPNRYRIFLEYPEANVQVRIEKHPSNPAEILVSVSKSIFNRTLKKTHLGQLMEQYGGGGVDGAGTCTFKDKIDLRLKLLLDALKR